MRLIAAAISLALVLGVSSARAEGGWTFCVASASGLKDVWITDVFAANRNRERLEQDLKGLLRAQGVEHAVAQCPAPEADKTAAVNAQFTAAEFNRKLGRALHEVSAPEFEPRK
jgi:hypothetical protein